MKHYNFVVFDLDGTLLDTREGVIAATIQTMQDYNREIPDRKVLEGLIGPPIQVSFQKFYNLTDSDAMQMANDFRNKYMMDEFLFKAVPYDGIFELFNKLVALGIKIGIATYKREDYAKRLLCQKGFDRYTQFIYGSDFSGNRRKEDIIRLCLDDMACVDSARAVYIGDGESDGIGANNAGTDFIAVTYGFGFNKKEDALVHRPSHVAASVKDLTRILIDDHCTGGE